MNATVNVVFAPRALSRHGFFVGVERACVYRLSHKVGRYADVCSRFRDTKPRAVYTCLGQCPISNLGRAVRVCPTGGVFYSSAIRTIGGMRDK